MGRACNTSGKEKECIQGFDVKSRKKETIKIDLRRI
jgi:hypothetical protein